MKTQEYKQLYDCDNDASISLKSETTISNFITADPERATLFTSIYLYKLAYCLLRVVAERFENYFPEIDFSKYFELCIDSNCHPKRICELSGSNLNKKNKRPPNYTIFELITHSICSAISIYDKENNNDEKLRQEHFGNANAYFYEARQKEFDKANGSRGRALRTEEENKVKAELIRLYKALSKNKKSKSAITLVTDLYPPLLVFIKKEELKKKDYKTRTIETWINEYRNKTV